MYNIYIVYIHWSPDGGLLHCYILHDVIWFYNVYECTLILRGVIDELYEEKK